MKDIRFDLGSVVFNTTLIVLSMFTTNLVVQFTGIQFIISFLIGFVIAWLMLVLVMLGLGGIAMMFPEPKHDKEQDSVPKG